MLQQLLKIHQEKKELELELTKKRSLFEESIALERAKLDDLEEKENLLKEESILYLESEGRDSIDIEGYKIYKQVKKTKQIDNALTLQNSILSNGIKLIEIGIDPVQLNNEFELTTQVKNKKLILDAVEKFEQVEGKILDGVIIKETKFVTIKEN